MLFGLLIVLASVAGTAGLVGFGPSIAEKWSAHRGKKWERRLLEGAEREERKPTEEELAEASKELEDEDVVLERKFKELEARLAQR